MRRALILLAAAFAVAAAGLALFGAVAATAALAASWLCGLGWMVLRSRAESVKLNQLLKHHRASRRALRQLQSTAAGLDRRSSGGSRSEQQTAQQLKLIRKELYRVLVWVQRTPSVTQELRRVYNRVVDYDRPMPELGDWAMSASTLIWLLDRLENPSIRTILECGSGSSTVWFATALATRGGEGRVVALETSADYAESTRQSSPSTGSRIEPRCCTHRWSTRPSPAGTTSHGSTSRCCPTCRRSTCCSSTDRSAGWPARRGTRPFRCWLPVSRLRRRSCSTTRGGRPRQPSFKPGSRSPTAAGASNRCGAWIARPRS